MLASWARTIKYSNAQFEYPNQKIEAKAKCGIWVMEPHLTLLYY